MNTLSYIEFSNYPLQKKVDFFDNGVAAIIQSVEEIQLYKFLKEIILNITENAFVRKSAISTLVESVFLGKIKDRQAVSVLVDEWEKSEQIFVEVQRIKDLFYFYNLEPEIHDIYTSYLENEEMEIVTEAQLNLGFIHLQKGFEAVDKNDKITLFQRANQYFIESDNSIENRIDAKFYRIVSSVLLDLLSLKTANIDNQLNQLSEILKEKWLNSFDFKENVMDVSFFRTLTSISNIIKEKPESWIEYPQKFDELYQSYTEIQNQAIKKRLNQSNLSQVFINLSKEMVIEPYFALNFHAQIIKIDICILKYPEDSPIIDFLKYIKKLAEGTDFKKKVDAETIEQKLKNCFPQRNDIKIKEIATKIQEAPNIIEAIPLLGELNASSTDRFIDVLISACCSLQGNRIYSFSNKDIKENDRNTYISDLLGAAGYQKEPQTLWGESPGGKTSGEIDILIKDSRGLPFTIIEALNLDSVESTYISEHINKVFNKYDTTGLENNFIVAYVNVANFGGFCERYINYISTKHQYKYTFQSVEEVKDYRYADLKLYKADHIRQNNKIFLYHIIINFSE